MGNVGSYATSSLALFMDQVRKPYLTNSSNSSIWFKPEERMVINKKVYEDGGAYELKPGGRWYYRIDGIAAPHLRKGQIYKVIDGGRLKVFDDDLDLELANVLLYPYHFLKGGWKDVFWWGCNLPLPSYIQN